MTKKKINVKLLFLVIGITVFGILMIYSASSYSSEVNYGDDFFFVKKQLLGLVFGVIAMIGMFFFDYHRFVKLRYWVIGLSLLLLVAVFIPGISISNYGARRWIGFGGFSIQSSEIAKFGFVIFTSCYMAKHYKKMHTFKGFMPVVLVGGLICLLILLEPNLSVTLCVGMVLLSMLVIGGISKKWFFIILVPALLLIPLLIIIEPYRLQRLVAFVNPWANPKEEGFQLIQSLYSLGAGGFFGVGLFNSRQKYLFLPFSESDFIFSIIGEEIGFFGCIVVCLVYVLIIAQGIKIAIRAVDRLGSYLAFGITSVIAFQVLINICVVTGTIPPTGIPLPFISSGGTSLMVFWGAIGILLNIHKQSAVPMEYTERTFFKRRNKAYVWRKTPVVTNHS